MPRIKMRIPAMQAVVVVVDAREMSQDFAVHGRTYFHRKQALSDALAALDEALAEETKRHEEALASRGSDCPGCGQRFLPLPDDFSGCCSIGCRLK
jgi:hypothetical protein